MILFVILIALAGALTDQQADMARTIMKARGVPPWSTVVDAALSDQVAFTQQDRHIVYVDALRLGRTPNTFYNVMVHECGHLLGAQHGDGSLAMDYAVTARLDGTIIDDLSRIALPPRR